MSLKSYDRNPLARFRSYRYYFALVVCDNTDTATAVAASQEINVWQHPEVGSDLIEPNMGIYSPVDVKVDGVSVGKYCVLINGSTDSAFMIESCTWRAMVMDTAYPGGYGNSIYVGGKMTVVEPRGIMFYEQVFLCCQALGVDFGAAQFLIKPFFVGYLDDNVGIGETHITNVKPVVVTFKEMNAAFTEQGGTYTMEFLGSGAGLAQMPQFARACDGFTITPKDTLKNTIIELENIINERYDKYHECMMEYLTKTIGDDPSLYLKVKYSIVLADTYLDPSYTIEDGTSVYKNNAAGTGGITLKHPVGGSIEDLIQQIMSQSKKVQLESTEGVEGVRFVPKIIGKVNYHSNSVDVVYTIKRSVEASSMARVQQGEEERRKNPSAASSSQSNSFFTQEVLDNNMVEFDYIYTGKNVDVLEFDMHMKNGLSYAMSSIHSNSFRDQLQSAASRSIYLNPNLLTSHRTDSPSKIPLFYGTQGRQRTSNTENGNSKTGHMYTLSTQAFYEHTSTTMKITGNLSLLENTSLLTYPGADESVRDEVTTRKTASYAGDYKPIATDYDYIPLLVKVNVMMPALQDDLEIQRRGVNYSSNFWFDGYYFVTAVNHEFVDGLFTQTLEMRANPNPKVQAEMDIHGKKQTVSSQQPPNLCFEALQCKAKPSEVKNDKPVHTAPTNESKPEPATNLTDAETLFERVQLSDVKGWDKASQEVKDAIIDAAKKFSVPAVTMAMIAHNESSFNPTAAAPTSTAVGLFQFLEKTWRNVMNNNGYPQYSALHYRTDPRIASVGAGLFFRSIIRYIGSSSPGDIYLAWFAGEPRAKQIIQYDRAGKGSTPLSQLSTYGVSAAEDVYRANPTLVKNGAITANGIRTWAAKKAAKAIKNFASIDVKKAQQARTNDIKAAEQISNAQVLDKNAAAKVVNTKADKPTGMTFSDVLPQKK